MVATLNTVIGNVLTTFPQCLRTPYNPLYSKVHISPEKIWKPDVRLFNSVTHEDYEDTDVIVYNTGQLFWVPPLTTHTTCQV